MVRQLTAIMFTDMVGFTALMQSDEERAHELRERQLAVLRRAVREHHGDLLQLYGDGSLSVFRSAVEAVACAVEIQRALREEPAIPLRIGVHSGDVVHDDGGVYGDGVNVAARIQGLAVAGSVLLSAKVFDEVKNHPEIETVCLGPFQLKNVRRTWDVYAVTSEGITVPDDDALAPGRVASARSIAVLPFADLGPEPDNEHFSDGIAEELINALTQVNGLQVIARSSSFVFRSQGADVRGVASQLGVTHVLTGSVRRLGDRVRVGVQLLDAQTGHHVFADRYDRGMEDVFAVQDEIATGIVARIASHLAPVRTSEAGVTTSLVRKHSHDTAAYEEYLKGRFHHAQWTPPSARRAILHFERSASLDPWCALPHVGLASAHVFLARTGHLPADHAYPRALEAAQRALQLDEGAGEAYRVRALVKLFYEWDWGGSYRDFQKALSLTPGSAEVHHAYGLYLRAAGEHLDAVEEMREALALDPLAVHYRHALAVALERSGSIEEAEEELVEVLREDPTFRAATEALGWIRVREGKWKDAAELFEQIPTKAGLPYAAASNRGYVYARMERFDEARRMMELLLARAAVQPEVNLEMDFALLHAGLGDTGNAVAALGRAADGRVGAMVFLRSSTVWDEPLRSDPRFVALADRIGCPTPGGIPTRLRSASLPRTA